MTQATEYYFWVLNDSKRSYFNMHDLSEPLAVSIPRGHLIGPIFPCVAYIVALNAM